MSIPSAFAVANDRAGALASHLNRVGVSARAIASASVSARTLARARDFNRALDGARASASDFHRALDCARDLVSALDRTHVTIDHAILHRDRALAALDRARETFVTLARALDSADAGDFDRDVARSLVRARSLARDLTRALARDLDAASHIVSEHAGHSAARRRAGRGGARVAPMAVRLLKVVGRLLPPADRLRYAGEFRSELWDLAHAGAGRWTQMAYAGRQAGSVLRLRTALRAPARRRAVQ